MAHVCIVEGLIASGKSTLIKQLAAYLSTDDYEVCPVYEPVEQWEETGILKAFYANPTKEAYPFQSFVCVSRIMAIKKAFSEHPNAGIYLLERSPATDAIFWGIQRDSVDPMYDKMYSAWRNEWISHLPFDPRAARVIYLRTSLASCMQRLAARSRDGEVSGVTAEYQEKLLAGHDALYLGIGTEDFVDMPHHPYGEVVVIDADTADKNFKDFGDEQTTVLSMIARVMRQSFAKK